MPAKLLLVLADGNMLLYDGLSGDVDWVVPTGGPLVTYEHAEAGGGTAAGGEEPQQPTPTTSTQGERSTQRFDTMVPDLGYGRQLYVERYGDLHRYEKDAFRQLMSKPVYVGPDNITVTTTTNVSVMELCVDTGDVVSGAMKDFDVGPPGAEGIAVTRLDITIQKRLRNVCWSKMTASYVDVSPVRDNAERPLLLRGSADRTPHFEVYVDGTVRSMEGLSDGDVGGELWSDTTYSEVVRAYCLDHGQVRPVPVHILPLAASPAHPHHKSGGKEPGSASVDAVFYDKEARFLFVSGDVPTVWRVQELHLKAFAVEDQMRHNGGGGGGGGVRSWISGGSIRTPKLPSGRGGGGALMLQYQPKPTTLSLQSVQDSASVAPDDASGTTTSEASGDEGERTSPTAGFYSITFETVGLLGRGGFGRVYLARHRQTRLNYAVKVIPLPKGASADTSAGGSVFGSVSSEDDRHAALREAKTHAMLHHQNIVRFHSCWVEEYSGLEELSSVPMILSGEPGGGAGGVSPTPFDEGPSESESPEPTNGASDDDGRLTVLFIQMEFLDMTLDKWLRRRPCDRGVCGLTNASIAKQLIEGLLYLHQNGVVHRDLKPSNIFIEASSDSAAARKKRVPGKCPAQGTDVRVKIGDFGLAKYKGALELDESPEGGLYDEPNTVGVGTPLYSSQEQLHSGRCTPQDDIFSLGVVLYELYVDPSTAHERIVLLQKARERDLLPAVVKEFPREAEVILSMLCPHSPNRVHLKDARRVFKQVLGDVKGFV